MFVARVLAALDGLISGMFLMSSDSSSPGPDGAARAEHYFGMIGPRYVIFRRGKVEAIGGIFEIEHRYDAKCRLLSREFRRNVEFQHGDAILYGYRTVTLGLYEKDDRSGVGVIFG